MRVWKQPLGVWVLGATLSATAAMAEAQEDKAAAAQPSPPAATSEVQDPSLGASGFDIAPAKVGREAEREAPAQRAAAAEPAAAPDGAFADKLSNLWRCRYQVAMEQRKAPKDVQAGRMLVRFDVDRSGSVVEPTVVALEPAAPEVLTCVTRDIQGWQMSPAPEQRVRVETEIGGDGPTGSGEQGNNAKPAAQSKKPRIALQ